MTQSKTIYLNKDFITLTSSGTLAPFFVTPPIEKLANKTLELELCVNIKATESSGGSQKINLVMYTNDDRTVVYPLCIRTPSTNSSVTLQACVLVSCYPEDANVYKVHINRSTTYTTMVSEYSYRYIFTPIESFSFTTGTKLSFAISSEFSAESCNILQTQVNLIDSNTVLYKLEAPVEIDTGEASLDFKLARIPLGESLSEYANSVLDITTIIETLPDHNPSAIINMSGRHNENKYTDMHQVMYANRLYTRRWLLSINSNGFLIPYMYSVINAAQSSFEVGQNTAAGAFTISNKIPNYIQMHLTSTSTDIHVKILDAFIKLRK